VSLCFCFPPPAASLRYFLLDRRSRRKKLSWSSSKKGELNQGGSGEQYLFLLFLLFLVCRLAGRLRRDRGREGLQGHRHRRQTRQALRPCLHIQVGWADWRVGRQAVEELRVRVKNLRNLQALVRRREDGRGHEGGPLLLLLLLLLGSCDTATQVRSKHSE
jgi:hypothetical protein